MSERDGRHDFDFLSGRWRIENERLVGRLQGSTTWETFHAVGVIRPVLGGTGNVDECSTDHRPGFQALSLGVFNPTRKLWSIHWVDNASGALKPPTVGRFGDGRGDFFGDDTIDGREIKVHFVWANVDTPSPTWLQEFSADGGQTLEVNWRMTLTRIYDDTDASRASTGPSSSLLAPGSSLMEVA